MYVFRQKMSRLPAKTHHAVWQWPVACLLLSIFLHCSPVCGQPRPVDFDTEIVPILARYGCSAAKCHGGSQGRGGFRLSLFGSDPADDFYSIVQQLESRRVNFVHPERSLLVTKPTLILEHGGEQRFDFDSRPARTFLRWIEEGANRQQLRQLSNLGLIIDHEKTNTAIAENLPYDLKFSVLGHYSDDTTVDITWLAVITPSDPAAVEIVGDGAIRVVRPGWHWVTVGMSGQNQVLQITAPFPQPEVELSSDLKDHFIDREIESTLIQLRIPPAGNCSDADFARRIYLDLTGRLPTLDQQREFLAETRPDKRALLVERLFETEAFVDYWTFRLAQLFRIRMPAGDKLANDALYKWLREQVANDRPWNELAFELLTGSGDSHQSGPAAFQRLSHSARAQAEFVTETFMGTRMRCANCHNHPLDRWTQADYHGLAAVFSQLDRGVNVQLNPRGNTIDPRTGKPAVPQIPGGPPLQPSVDPRIAFADWLTGPDNPYLSRAIVNRIWKHLLGRGLIESPDDLRDTNPASHSRLLELLAADFREHELRLRHTIRSIVNSRVYQRGTATTEWNAWDQQFFSYATRRALPAEVLIDAICDVTDVAESFGDLPLGTRAIQLQDPLTPSRSLDLLGRCDRNESCESDAVNDFGVATKLHLINSKLINAKLVDRRGRLQRLLSAGKTDEQIFAEFYQRALVRKPNSQELDYWLAQIRQGENREQVLQDFVWSLLNCQEFTTNH